MHRLSAAVMRPFTGANNHNWAKSTTVYGANKANRANYGILYGANRANRANAPNSDR
jgi:hypothetical protein